MEFDQYLDLPLTEARSQLLEDFERVMIIRAVDLEAGNVSAAARRLGIHRQSLQQKMKQLGLR
jgi:transcriptional regulator of acetoin/glycerol metabolism